MGEEYVRMVDENGKSVLVPISVVQAFVSTNQRFALYDGAVATVPGPFAQYSEQFSGGNFTHKPRLEFGDLTDETYWPDTYAGLLVNLDSAPDATIFDFRNLPLGTFVQFDIELNLKYGDDNGFRIDEQFVFFYKMTYPNLSTETRTFTIPSDFIAATPASVHFLKMSFSAYIKNATQDQLRGGEMEYGVVDTLTGGTRILTVKDLIVRAKL